MISTRMVSSERVAFALNAVRFSDERLSFPSPNSERGGWGRGDRLAPNGGKWMSLPIAGARSERRLAALRKRVRGTEETHRGFDRGVRQIVAAIRPTLGP